MPNCQFKSSGLAWTWVAMVVWLLDRATKYFALQDLPPYSEVAIVPHFNLTLAYNTGAAFSFLNSASGWQVWALGVVAAVVSLIILVWLCRLSARDRWICIALSLVIGGALGNLSDRILYGHVVDFLDFYAGNVHFPSFNIADSAICVGAVMLFFDAVFFRKKS